MTKLKFTVLFFISIISIFVGIFTGSVHASIHDLWEYLKGKGNINIKGYIIWEVRVPRTLGAFLGGACLAVSGLLLQTYFRNPLAGPYVLGISSAASLTVALYILVGISVCHLGIVGSAFLGSIIATILILSLAAKVRSAVTLLVIGLMISYLFSAFEKVLITFAESQRVHQFVLWTFGSFSGITWDNLKIIALIAVPTIIFTLTLSKPLNALLLGEEYAKSLGVNVKIVRITIVMLSSLLTSIVTAFAGIVAFVGLAVPHMARFMFRTSDHRILLPVTLLLGAILTVLCDTMSRILFYPVELPISVVTSMFGAPVVIYLVIRRRGNV